jgi:hypothetical protein
MILEERIEEGGEAKESLRENREMIDEKQKELIALSLQHPSA